MSAGRWSRRAFASSVLASSALALAPGVGRAAPAARRHRGGPSKLLVIHTIGGMDSLFSFDPKEAAEVKPNITPVYPMDQILCRGDVRLAPGWHSLAPYMDRLQIIHGIQTSSVAHPTSEEQLRQMRRGVVPREPSITTLLGEVLAPEAPLHEISLSSPQTDPQRLPGRHYVANEGASLVALHTLANDERRAEEALQTLAAEIAANRRGEEVEPFRAVEFLLRRLRGTPAAVAPPMSARIDVHEWPAAGRDRAKGFDGIQIGLALSVLAHDLAPVVLVNPRLPGSWDTHALNDQLQQPLNHQLARWMRYLLDEMNAIPRPGGTLLDEVGVLVVSEIGRFPYRNGSQGKDHFPQVSALLMGRGLAPGVFGGTDSEMLGLEVSTRTGRPHAGGRGLTLDDLGRTLLEWVGHPDPEGQGYGGGVLEFCFA